MNDLEKHRLLNRPPGESKDTSPEEILALAQLLAERGQVGEEMIILFYDQPGGFLRMLTAHTTNGSALWMLETAKTSLFEPREEGD